MNSIKGIYHNGIVEPIIKPKIDIPTEVIIIFPDEAKRVTKIGGLYKNVKIDYEQIEKELKELFCLKSVICMKSPEYRYQ